MRIKVCGMNYPGNVAAVDDLGVDMIGFIFYPQSRRRVTMSPEALPPTRARRVGVFVNQGEEEIVAMVKRYSLDGVQLHGDESPDFCLRLRHGAASRIFLMKAISVAGPEDLRFAKAYQEVADYLLFDTRCDGYGGSGRHFDWSMLSAYAGRLPFLLSGGIGPGDECRVMAFRHPLCAGIDLNSRFEQSLGLKDVNSLSRFIRHVRSDSRLPFRDDV